MKENEWGYKVEVVCGTPTKVEVPEELFWLKKRCPLLVAQQCCTDPQPNLSACVVCVRRSSASASLRIWWVTSKRSKPTGDAWPWTERWSRVTSACVRVVLFYCCCPFFFSFLNSTKQRVTFLWRFTRIQTFHTDKPTLLDFLFFLFLVLIRECCPKEKKNKRQGGGASLCVWAHTPFCQPVENFFQPSMHLLTIRRSEGETGQGSVWSLTALLEGPALLTLDVNVSAASSQTTSGMTRKVNGAVDVR